MSAKGFFQLFLFPTNWDLQLNVLFLLGAFIYLLITGPLKHFFPNPSHVPVSQKIYFMLGWITYYLAIGSPIDLLGHELFSMHMLQMSLLYIVMPPLLLLGLPAYLLRPLLQFKWIQKIGGFLTRPLIIMFLFNGAISLYHVPIIFDKIMGNHVYHVISHTFLLILALCMWWPVICPIPEWDRVKSLYKLAFIFVNGILLTPACALIIFADHTLFAFYSKMSELVPIMSPIQDQQLGGIIMKIIQEIVYIFAIGIVFLQWLRIEKEKDKQDLLEWQQEQTPSIQNS